VNTISVACAEKANPAKSTPSNINILFIVIFLSGFTMLHFYTDSLQLS